MDNQAELAESTPLDVDKIITLMLAGFNATPYHQHIGLVLNYEQGKLKGHFSKQTSLIGNSVRNMVHGGLMSSVFDAVGGVLCSLELIEHYRNLEPRQAIRKLNRLCTTDLSIHYHAPAKAEHFYCTGKVVHRGSSTCHVTMEMHDEHSTLLATAQGSYMY